MTDLAAILRYMAEVAAADEPPQHSVGKIVWLSQTGAGDVVTVWPNEVEGVKRFVAADALHKEQHLIWQGYLWIQGSYDGRNYRVPMVRRRVSARSVIKQLFDSTVGVPLTLQAESAWLVNTTLLDSESFDALADRPIEWGIGGSSGGGRIDRNHPGVAAFVSAYLEGCGLPADTPLHAGVDDADPPLRVTLATGLYLDSDPYRADRSSALKLWATRAPIGTALEALYFDDTRPGGPPREVVVRSPLPLNDEQRRAIELSVNEDLVVVSGPPGTGKSHLAAAAAISEIAAGGSVLIASKSIHACNVIEGMLRRFPMIEPIRFGDDRGARLLGNALASGVPAPDERYDQSRLTDEVASLEAEIQAQLERIRRRLIECSQFDRVLRRREDLPLWLASRDIDAIDTAAVRAALPALDPSGPLGKRRARRARARIVEQLGVRAPEDAAAIREICDAIDAARSFEDLAGRDLGLPKMWDGLDALEDQWRHLIGDVLEADRRARANLRSRSALGELATALRTGPVTRRRELATMGGRFLDVAPLWLGTLGEIETTAPIVPGLFDLVILDEASQISQLSAAPALARAKRAMVIGDSRQLRHESFVTENVQRLAAVQAGVDDGLRRRLDDRANSVFDAASSSAPVVDLVEHYRSSPHIIGFSNREFYDSRLQLMTQHPRHEAADGIDVVRVSGRRSSEGVLPAEVNRAIELVHQLVAEGVEGIGVVTPVQIQADVIEEKLHHELTLEQIDRHSIRVGTVEEFQGTEREVVIISLCMKEGDDDVTVALEDPALFNVMVTRARSRVIVLAAFDPAELSPGLLARYLRHAEEPPTPKAERIDGSGWTRRLARELAAGSDARVIVDYEVAGETVDIVLGDGANALAIETELHPGGPQRHIDRHMVLRRAGWEILDMFESTAFGREEEVIASLLARVARQD